MQDNRDPQTAGEDQNLPGRGLFRRESLDHITSPEQMRDYLRVTNPRLWMLLGVILVLLVGFIVYASTARMESTIAVKLNGTADDASLYGYITETQADIVKLGMPVRVKGLAEEDGAQPLQGRVATIFRETMLRLDLHMDDGSMPEDGWYTFKFEPGSVPDGLSEDEILLLAVINGVPYYYENNTAFKQVFGVNRRIRLDEGGRLGTITGSTVSEMVQITVALDGGMFPAGNGVHDAEIVTETTTPLSFLLN